MRTELQDQVRGIAIHAALGPIRELDAQETRGENDYFETEQALRKLLYAIEMTIHFDGVPESGPDQPPEMDVMDWGGYAKERDAAVDTMNRFFDLLTKEERSALFASIARPYDDLDDCDDIQREVFYATMAVSHLAAPWMTTGANLSPYYSES